MRRRWTRSPTTGRIGEPASRSNRSTRKILYTVEAVSVDPSGARQPLWIGINQTAANRYVETALGSGLLPQIVTAKSVRRETFLGQSRLDFLVNADTYVG
ncbi:hypothetical protein [Streptomyces sp. NPDC055506]